MLDAFGRSLTFCRARESVGWHNVHGILKPTRTFVIVTAKVTEDGFTEHDIITAYPVSPRKALVRSIR